MIDEAPTAASGRLLGLLTDCQILVATLHEVELLGALPQGHIDGAWDALCDLQHYVAWRETK